MGHRPNAHLMFGVVLNSFDSEPTWFLEDEDGDWAEAANKVLASLSGIHVLDVSDPHDGEPLLVLSAKSYRADWDGFTLIRDLGAPAGYRELIYQALDLLEVKNRNLNEPCWLMTATYR